MNNDSENAAQYLRVHLKKPVVLVGMMGVGKTHSGRRLAERLGLEFYDSDKIIEDKAGRSVAEIFETFGEEKFREAERNSIMDVLSGGACVLATGGGAVVNNETRAAIRRMGVSIWLKVPVAEILRRVGGGHSRPLLRTGDPEEILTRLSRERERFYAEADIHAEWAPGMQESMPDLLINSLYEHIKTSRV
jgi:shikimate kinase